ncbi:MAG TPA: HAMP domain-containing sensor histidine kinase [Planctomicrobium sp.]|nr:HAMP domain-containing sensor histidine kinase [Planctomicrobium sp.]
MSNCSTDDDAVRWLSQCPPWLGSFEMAELILNSLGTAVSEASAGWAWIDPATGTASLTLKSFTLKSPDQPFLHQQHSQFSENTEKHLLATVAKQVPELEWRCCHPVPLDESRPILLGLSSERWDSFLASPNGRLLFTLGSQVFEWGLEFQRRLHLEKLASLAEYAAGAGHEINNPLGSIIGRASQLLKGEPDPERRRTLENIGAQAYRIRDMIGDTMLFARPPAPVPVEIDPVAAIHEVLSRFSEPCLRQQISVNVTSSGAFLVPFDPHQFAIVISELLRNSLHALPNGRQIHIQLESAPQNGRDGLRIDFTDNGPGLTEEQVRHCFDPFFSGRQAGRGLGFGLSKCWQILRQHQGGIELLSSTAESTTFRLWIPIQNGNDSDESASKGEGT